MTYPDYMLKIENILFLKLHDIQNVNYLKRLFLEFQTKRGFHSLSQHDQRNLKSGFKKYILYVSELSAGNEFALAA